MLCGASINGGSGGLGNVSKKATALPFLPRHAYAHAHGRRRGQPVLIWDIFKGASLHLSAEHINLPDAIRRQLGAHVELEVVDVDELEKENALVSHQLAVQQQGVGLHADQLAANVADIKARLARSPHTDAELADMNMTHSMRTFMRKQLDGRSVEVYMGLAAKLKRLARANQQVCFQCQQSHFSLFTTRNARKWTHFKYIPQCPGHKTIVKTPIYKTGLNVF